MHIPDGFLDTKTIVATSILSVSALGISLHRLKKQILPHQIPLVGLAAAFVFVAQMLNFPVIGGTSGHIIGSVLAAVLLGPNAAILIMTTVLVVQCFLFADGGVLSLGANILNMGIIGTLVGYSIYRSLARLIPTDRGRLVAIAFASWCSTVLASIFCAGELVWSGIASWQIAFPAMANIHMLIGIGEALITTIVFTAILKTKPEFLHQSFTVNLSLTSREIIIYGAIVIMGLLIFVSPFISELPDGLETVAHQIGFDRNAVGQPLFPSPLADYQLPGMSIPAVATIFVGFIGAVIVFGGSFLLARFLIPNKK
ncbi:MAG: energy-coupling factor ABC transporter permease [Bacteroidota bacterium]|nr:energy-coupling factor ABC transporter permease [Bacteroidota bacterium]